MELNTRVLRWLRDVAVTVMVLTACVIALGALTGQAYAGLPVANPSSQPRLQQAASVSPHGPQPVCASCHRSHSAPEGTLLIASEVDNAICTRCHSAAGDAPAVSSHSNVDFAAATQPAFNMSCALCHDPHGDPAKGNRAMVRASAGGLPVAFAGVTGADSFDDGLDDGVHDSICVVCHTTTSHNNSFSADLIGQGHGPVGSDCTACHPHGGDPSVRAGFMPNVSATPTATATPAPPTETPTATASPTDTPAAASTDTPVPPPTATSEPSATPSPSDTPAPPTDTPTPSATPPP